MQGQLLIVYNSLISNFRNYIKMSSRKPAQGWRQLNINFVVCTPSAKCGAIVFFVLSLMCSIFAIVLLSYTSEIIEYNHCFTDSSTISITQSMNPPVYIYLKYSNYYQNFRIYAKSLSLSQLEGKSDSALDKSCKPIVTLKDLDYPGPIYNYEKTLLLSNYTIADPCGSIAASFINYTIILSNKEKNIKIDTDGIEWKSYEVNKYKNKGNQQYLDKENSHFKIWMRTAALNSFLKLYGKINEKVEGNYDVVISKGTDYLDSDPKPCLMLSTTNTMGGKNYVLGWAMLFCAVLCIVWTFVFGFLSKCFTAQTLEEAFKIDLDMI